MLVQVDVALRTLSEMDFSNFALMRDGKIRHRVINFTRSQRTTWQKHESHDSVVNMNIKAQKQT